MIDYPDKCQICNDVILGSTHKYRFLKDSEFLVICDECRDAIRGQNQEGRKAEIFWDKYHKSCGDLPHICDISLEELRKRHHWVLELTKIFDKQDIGTLLAGKRYKDVWNSRSCSGHLAELMGINEDDAYCCFYCGSSNYYVLCTYGSVAMLKMFELANELDEGERP